MSPRQSLRQHMLRSKNQALVSILPTTAWPKRTQPSLQLVLLWISSLFILPFTTINMKAIYSTVMRKIWISSNKQGQFMLILSTLQVWRFSSQWFHSIFLNMCTHHTQTSTWILISGLAMNTCITTITVVDIALILIKAMGALTRALRLNSSLSIAWKIVVMVTTSTQRYTRKIMKLKRS